MILERIVSLGIPPAWTDVWIAPAAHDHIQALGTDAAGRRQYLYHPKWREAQDREKFDRMLDFADALPAARRTVTHDLRQEGLVQRRVLAGAFRLIDSSGIRSGSEEYERDNGSYGLTTLLGRHVTVRGGREVILSFPGKSGKEWYCEVNDPDLAALVTQLKRRGSQHRLFAYKNDQGAWRPLKQEDVNAYIRERTRGEFTAKDFRTLQGTAAAAESLARSAAAGVPRSTTRAVKAAMDAAADVLGNTPAIAKKSYVDPRIIDRFEHGETVELGLGRNVELALRPLVGS